MLPVLSVAKYHDRYGIVSLRNCATTTICVDTPFNLLKLHNTHVWLHRIESDAAFKLQLFHDVNLHSKLDGDKHVLDESVPLFLARDGIDHARIVDSLFHQKAILTVELIPREFGWSQLKQLKQSSDELFWTTRRGGKISLLDPAKYALFAGCRRVLLDFDMVEFLPVLTKQNFQTLNLCYDLPDLRTAGLMAVMSMERHRPNTCKCIWFVVTDCKLTSLAQYAKTQIVVNEGNEPGFTVDLMDVVIHNAFLGAWSSQAFQLVVDNQTISSVCVDNQHCITQHYFPLAKIVVCASCSVDVLVETVDPDVVVSPVVCSVLEASFACQEGTFVRAEHTIPDWMNQPASPSQTTVLAAQLTQCAPCDVEADLASLASLALV